MARITVDGRVLEADESNNLLEALLGQGEDLPYFCWHPEMGSVGACRQCAVVQYMNEDDQNGRIVMSCMTAVTDGSIFSVQGEAAASFRQSVVENLMLNHPHDCPVCEEGGECHLQDMTVMTGHRDRTYRHLKTTFRNQYLGPFIGHEMNRCITCFRCVRFYQDYAGGDDLSAFASRDRVYFGRSDDGVLENEFAGNLVEVCPTGVFTDKILGEHYTRKWDLQSAPAVCTGCSIGCNITVSERYGQVRRVNNRYHGEINGYFLCDRGRFGAEYVNCDDRIPYCGIRNANGIYEATSSDETLAHVKALIDESQTIIGIGSPRASLEANFVLRTLVGKENFYSGLSNSEAEISKLLLDVLNSDIKTPSLTEVKDCDAVLILGEDTTNHAPILALSLRQSARNEAKNLSRNVGIPLWQDAAVRKLAQDVHSPLFILTSFEDRLDDIGIPTRMSPEDIASAGFSIANGIDDSFPAGTVGHADIQTIVDALIRANKPLVVTGSSPASPDIVKAAINIANSLSKRNANTGLVICTDEANNLATVCLAEKSFPTSGADVAIVLENDLSRRIPGTALDSWLAQIKHLVVIDSLDNNLSAQSNVVLPAATFAEVGGTYINYEGRAQRSFGAFKPKGDIAPSWNWLLNLCHGQGLLHDVEHIDDLLQTLARTHTELAQVVNAAPDAGFRDHGQKISRMTHRQSGRTAMLADVNVHEPQQPGDDDSALTYSMEGENLSAPNSMRAYIWSPGWNSNQSINKFQDEISGPLRDGDPGVKLFAGSSEVDRFFPVESSPGGSSTGIRVVPRWHIFGSDELSNKGQAIHSLAPSPYALMNPHTASSLGVQAGEALKLSLSDAPSLPVLLDDSIPEGCVVCPVLEATSPYLHLSDGGDGALIKDESWAPAAREEDVIMTDRNS
ncbi:MAG: NADH-quinone oxidoreductase subunit NuoG [Gammaproteobacteria bacterium]|nr:NADH-quinone oxidoreductase subunit NuoG [Gammaproteobacteria bacterium]